MQGSNRNIGRPWCRKNVNHLFVAVVAVVSVCCVTGIALALTAALLYAGYIVVSDVLLQHIEPFPATTVIMIYYQCAFYSLFLIRGS